MLHLPGQPELEQRLGLYRVFVKLYDHHPGLLETILELETSDGGLQQQLRFSYVQVLIQNGRVHLVTNLGREYSQAIAQPQNIWMIGRDQQATIKVTDPRLSRHHAAIHYLDGEVYLIDLDSTNGSFINGEPVRQPTQLNDGDQVRLGSLSFTFFNPHQFLQADSLPPSLMQQIHAHHSRRQINNLPFQPTERYSSSEHLPVRSPKDENPEETVGFVQSVSVQAPPTNDRLNAEIPDSLQNHILDRFFKRHDLNHPAQD